MTDFTTRNRASDMQQAEGDREPDPGNQEQLVDRRPHTADPTRADDQRTSDATTISNGGLGGGRPEGGAKKTPERDKMEQPTLRTDI